MNASSLPTLKQHSVQKLIDADLLENKRGIEVMLERFKNSVIVRTLQIEGGNVSHAAALLKTNRNNLIRWMHENGIKADTTDIEVLQ